MFKGTIVENSLSDASILQELQVEKTWQAGTWVLHDVLVAQEQIAELSKHLADGPWYMHFWEPGQDEVLVVFKDKIFTIQHSDKSTWTEAIAYGKSLSIPEAQLDFLVE
ncbi:MAG: hypothetical protein JNK33_05345 [Candidatus Doudnabacteria bacterium]|nr:hypothetical protein [Candidatus Doudnabacteria bacterium]